MSERADIAVVGAGAAGLMAGIWAGRRARSAAMDGARIVILDGAKRLGAKILVSGGGRCNVTHDAVDERAFAGSSSGAIRKVLRRFDVPSVIEFFRGLGVELKREETGKLFPTTDDARTVLDALLAAARAAQVEIRHPWRVEEVKHAGGTGFVLCGPAGELAAERVILASGGMSLPKTGSDGRGYEIVRALGHSITPRIFPGLVPLLLPPEHWIRGLSGVSTRAAFEVRTRTGRKLRSFADAMLCTHFGLSGPAVLDISRYWIDAALDDAEAGLYANWLSGESQESVDRALLSLAKASPMRFLRERGLPERLARALCEAAHVDGSRAASQITRERRRALANLLVETRLPIAGNRGFNHAEVTAGGVPLRELKLETMESRMCPGLYVVGEICDVDGRIGGYNFQWAWASGYVAGTAAAGVPST